MTKTEEALCNGIMFSIPRFVPTAIQEGEIKDSPYYCYVILAPSLDKMILKIYDSSFELIKIKGKEIECIDIYLSKRSLTKLDESEKSRFDSYEYGYTLASTPVVYLYSINAEKTRINFEILRAYRALMLYPALKCIIIDLIKEIVELNEQEDEQ